MQQSSAIHLEPSQFCGCHGLMFLESSNPVGMPTFWVCTALYSVQKCPEVNGIYFPDWKIIAGGMNSGSFEPITGSVKFDVYSYKYAAVHIGMQNLG